MVGLALQVVGAVAETSEIHPVRVDREQDERRRDRELSAAGLAPLPEVGERDRRENRDRQERVDREPGDLLASPAVDGERRERPVNQETKKRRGAFLRRRTTKEQQRPNEACGQKNRREKPERSARRLRKDVLGFRVDRKGCHRDRDGADERVSPNIG